MGRVAIPQHLDFRNRRLAGPRLTQHRTGNRWEGGREGVRREGGEEGRGGGGGVRREGGEEGRGGGGCETMMPRTELTK